MMIEQTNKRTNRGDRFIHNAYIDEWIYKVLFYSKSGGKTRQNVGQRTRFPDFKQISRFSFSRTFTIFSLCEVLISS